MNRIVHCLPVLPSPLPCRGVTVTSGLRHRRGCPRYALFPANVVDVTTTWIRERDKILELVGAS